MTRPIKCPACESNRVRSRTDVIMFQRYMSDPVKSRIHVLRCLKCDQEWVDNRATSETTKSAMKRSRASAVSNVLRKLSQDGIQYAHIERAFGLAPRTISRWKNLNQFSAAVVALLRIVMAFPWILKVAMADFDAKIIRRELDTAANEWRDRIEEGDWDELFHNKVRLGMYPGIRIAPDVISSIPARLSAEPSSFPISA